MTQNSGRHLLALTGVGRTYPGHPPVSALKDATFTVTGGEMIAIIGRSGSGKSTLLNILGLLDQHTSGELRVGGCVVDALTDREQTRLRSEFLAFVFQQSFLLRSLSAQENVEMALRPRGLSASARRARAGEALEAVGLGHRRRFTPGRLSGGECQRVAIARALAQEPRVLLCDEPTGNLDEATSRQILETLVATRRSDRAIVIVTHDLAIAQSLPRVLSVRDGAVSEGAGAFIDAETVTATI